VTLNDLHRLAAKYLNKENNVVLILGDTKKFGQTTAEIVKPVLIKPED
jgi:hypothetical protein